MDDRRLSESCTCTTNGPVRDRRTTAPVTSSRQSRSVAFARHRNSSICPKKWHRPASGT